MAKKTVPYNGKGVNQLPDDKPVLYRIKTQKGGLNYAGSAKRGRVRERIQEHFDEIPGAKVQIEQFARIDEARNKEANIIEKDKPKYNELGK